MPWDFALILFALGVVLPWRGAVRMRKLLARPSLETADRLMLYVSTIVFQWLAVAVVAWRCYARGLNAQRLGVAFPEPVLTTVIAVALSLVLAANQFLGLRRLARDRKSTRLNSSHRCISYAVFCLKKKKKTTLIYHTLTSPTF